MKEVFDIEEAAKLCAKGEDITFVITNNNRYAILFFAFYQFKHKTNKEFKHISYRKSKDTLYYILKGFAKISFGYYKLTYDYIK